jgi:hypothetical protein
MVGQWDQVPGAGAAPTSSWRVNQLIVDDYQITLKIDQPPQRILIGLYDAQSGARLAVTETQHAVADERLELHTFP